jgi:hypothetical protein
MQKACQYGYYVSPKKKGTFCIYNPRFVVEAISCLTKANIPELL